MDDNNTPSHSGVVDPSILDVTIERGEIDTTIPDFLRVQAPVEGAPVFTTQEDPAGQVEVVIEPTAITDPVDVHVHNLLNQMEDQRVETQLVSEGVMTQEQIDAAHSQGTVVGEDLPKVPEPDTHEGNSDTQTNDEPGPGHNAPADPAEMRRDFFKDVNKFGKSSGEGASALGRLGLRALRAAADGVISTAKPQGGGKDDATLVYEAYTAMDSKHAEHTAGGAKANASKLRQIIGMGCMPTLSDPVAVGDRVVAIRERMEGADLKPKALFAALVDTAREQLASDTELSDAAIEGCCTKTKADKTLEKEWTAIQKRVEGLITGEASHGLKDNSDVALKISDLCLERLKQYKSDETRQDRIDNMIELGYTMAQAVAIVDKKINVAS